jgi:hypothetical protein
MVTIHISRLKCTFLGLQLLSLHNLMVITQVLRHPSVDAVLLGDLVLYQPRGAIPGLSGDCLLDERPQHRFGEYSAVAADLLVEYRGFFVRPIVEAHRIPQKGLALSAIRQRFAGESDLVPNDPLQLLAGIYLNYDGFARPVIGFELLVDHVDQMVNSRYRLELDASKDRFL